MAESWSARMKRNWKWWILASFLFVVLQGTGPCYNDECSNPGESWCSGETYEACEGAGMNQAYWRDSQDCAAQNLRCVEGRGTAYDGSETRSAWCLDVQNCDTVGQFQCGTSSVDGSPILMRCVNLASTDWYTQEGIKKFVSNLNLDLVLEPVNETGYGAPPENTLACAPCHSTCGCAEGTVCRDNLCVPSDVVDSEDEELVCCGQERLTDCPKGAACEMLDGSAGQCDTAARCDECSATKLCESSLLQCISSGVGLPTVCLQDEDVNLFTYQCRSELNQAWKKNVCGTWIEAADTFVAAYDCKKGTDEIWSLNACDQLIEMATDCGTGFRCESNECIKRVPEIEVNPTLLNFSDVSVSTTKTLTISIGNIGYWPLNVTEFVVQSEAADQIVLSESALEVGVNEIASVDVTFAPTQTGTVTGKILVRSDDQDEPEVTILVNGTAIP